MEKKVYCEPELELISYEESDVITASGDSGFGPGQTLPDIDIDGF